MLRYDKQRGIYKTDLSETGTKNWTVQSGTISWEEIQKKR